MVRLNITNLMYSASMSFVELKRRIQLTEKKLVDLEKLIREALEHL